MIAPCLASLAFYCMDSNDFRIAKIVIFSRAMQNALYMLGDVTGWYKPYEGQSNDKRRLTVESFFAILSSAYLCYAFVYEVKAMPPKFLGTMVTSTNMTLPEKKFFDAMRAVREIEMFGRKKL